MTLPQSLSTAFPQASEKLASIPKVTPEVMMIVYLDEIAGRLADLQDALSEITAEGEPMSFELGITSNPTVVPFVGRHLTVHNVGPNPAYVLADNAFPSDKDAPVRIGASVNYDYQTRKLRKFYLVCKQGETATVDVYIL